MCSLWRELFVGVLCVHCNITNHPDCVCVPDACLHWTYVMFIPDGYLPVYFAFDSNSYY